MKHIHLTLTLLLLSSAEALCCTSAIVSGLATPDGRPLLWKHRDTGTEQNFIARVDAHNSSELDYVALFNAGDSLLREAWTGMNSAGFAVMNTASYNLAPDTATIKDREGLIMSLALARCRTLTDFEALLDTLPKPLGVQANFGAIDASGAGAYYETDDYHYVKYDVAEAPGGVLLRTNFSCSGTCGEGLGHTRYANARHLLSPAIATAEITPDLLLRGLSRSFYHSGYGYDLLAAGDKTAEDIGFIPRRSTSASIVIQGGSSPEEYVMWTVAGYPPLSTVERVTADSIPANLLPQGPKWRSPAWERVAERKHRAIRLRNGRWMVDLDAIRRYIKGN